MDKPIKPESVGWGALTDGMTIWVEVRGEILEAKAISVADGGFRWENETHIGYLGLGYNCEWVSLGGCAKNELGQIEPEIIRRTDYRQWDNLPFDMVCYDCGKNYNGFSLKDDIWKLVWPYEIDDIAHISLSINNKYFLGPFIGTLCISCVEKRLNRKLKQEDFKELEINEKYHSLL